MIHTSLKKIAIMRSIFLVFVSVLFLVSCKQPQKSRYSGDLEIGRSISGTLDRESRDTFNLVLDKETFVFGIVDQVSADLVIQVFDSTGKLMRKFDRSGKGIEVFHFETEDSGPYVVELTPFEKDSGSYTILLKTVEPIAKTPEKRADQLFAPFSGKEDPGGVIGVMQNGEILFAKAYGMADITFDIPFSVETPTNIGSVSKQFTAFAILLLEQKGLLSLEDDIREHVPELPDYGAVVTIKNLLNHTNGLREVYNLMPLTGWKGEDGLRREEVIRILQKQEKLQNAPGEEFNYNNSAFILLAELVKRKTGVPFPQWMKENVFEPLEMTSTRVRSDPRTIIPGASRGYQYAKEGLKEAGDLYAAYGAGGIYTTIGDFTKWLENIHTARLGGPELIGKLVTPDTLNNGDTLDYGLGIGVGEYKGLKMYSHGGADIAHRAMLLYFPEIDAGVAALSNNATFPSGSIAYIMAELFFKDAMEADEEKEESEAKDSTGMEIAEDLLATYAGKYKVTSLGVVFEFSLQDGKLIFSMEGQPDMELLPRSDSVFDFKGVDATVTFQLDDDGKANHAHFTQGSAELELLRLAPYEPVLADLEALEGSYFSKELETFYTLEVKDTVLTLLIKNTDDIGLKPMEEDVFQGDVFFIGELAFVRDPTGNIQGFTVSNGRTKGIYFKKN